jgi:hypothetical protein
MKLKYLVIISRLILLSGMIIFFYAVIKDPFFIPFQDFDNIPKLQRDIYIRNSVKMQNLKNFGLVIILASIISTISITIYKKLLNKANDIPNGD